jgi:hypothetical protein
MFRLLRDGGATAEFTCAGSGASAPGVAHAAGTQPPRARATDVTPDSQRTTMRQLQRVLWSKGVLLNPQHLQMQDRYLEELLAFRLDALTFRPWGFSRLELDREALAGGVLVVNSAAGLMPARTRPN